MSTNEEEVKTFSDPKRVKQLVEEATIRRKEAASNQGLNTLSSLNSDNTSPSTSPSTKQLTEEATIRPKVPISKGLIFLIDCRIPY